MHSCNAIAVGGQRQRGSWGLLVASLVLKSVRDLVFKRIGQTVLEQLTPSCVLCTHACVLLHTHVPMPVLSAVLYDSLTVRFLLALAPMALFSLYLFLLGPWIHPSLMTQSCLRFCPFTMEVFTTHTARPLLSHRLPLLASGLQP